MILFFAGLELSLFGGCHVEWGGHDVAGGDCLSRESYISDTFVLWGGMYNKYFLPSNYTNLIPEFDPGWGLNP